VYFLFSEQYGCDNSYFQHAGAFDGKLFTVGSTCYELVHTELRWSEAENECVKRSVHTFLYTNTCLLIDPLKHVRVLSSFRLSISVFKVIDSGLKK